jgi:hypothetical protein
MTCYFVLARVSAVNPYEEAQGTVIRQAINQATTVQYCFTSAVERYAAQWLGPFNMLCYLVLAHVSPVSPYEEAQGTAIRQAIIQVITEQQYFTSAVER